MNARYPVVFFVLLLLLRFGAVSAYAQKISRDEFESQLRLAEVYEGTRDIQNATRVYEKLWESDSDNVIVFNGLLRNYFSLKRFDNAEKLLVNKLAQTSDTHSTEGYDLYLLLGRAEAFLNKKNDAIGAFHKAQSAVPNEDCVQLLPVANAMTDVNYGVEANALLEKITAGDNPSCAGQAANL